MLHINHNFKLILTHNNSEVERVEFYSNTAYDIRIRYENETIKEVVAWANTKTHEYLPNLTPVYREENGVWETLINYRPYRVEESWTVKEQSSYLAKYTADSSLGQASSTALTELLNALEIQLEENTRKVFQTSLLSKQTLNSILELYREETAGEWE